jgi:hypothetical protein
MFSTCSVPIWMNLEWVDEVSVALFDVARQYEWRPWAEYVEG